MDTFHPRWYSGTAQLLVQICHENEFLWGKCTFRNDIEDESLPYIEQVLISLAARTAISQPYVNLTLSDFYTIIRP